MTKIEDLYGPSDKIDENGVYVGDVVGQESFGIKKEVEEIGTGFYPPGRRQQEPFAVNVEVDEESKRVDFGLDVATDQAEDFRGKMPKNSVLDSFLDDILNHYQPEEMDEFHFTENIQHDFYVSPEVVVDFKHVADVIDAAFESYPDRISFSVEELGLHNRLTELQGVSREGGQYVLIKSEKGDIVVNKSRNRDNKKIIKTLLEEAKECLRLGKRMEMTLLEPYTIKDSHEMEQTRYRFRASLAEIKETIRITKMKGTITRDCFLVIYE